VKEITIDTTVQTQVNQVVQVPIQTLAVVAVAILEAVAVVAIGNTLSKSLSLQKKHDKIRIHHSIR
jgi:hypothetical protein